ncbi:MAG: PTS sugar transporter subunit IIA [Deltaproteobacteria bacterium]|nr:PTS sugar transporter subunit IIA [Deltaproteobacteria bacterium]RLB91247.1 MAG: PTS sugar transporter subunit IIA [Deltaproteobacteria bacterium]RLB92705.1 MAG: PTS sugar transporter subunit IIA [Deltaproteobacteria bacterium]RLC08951.1 MAG: PTS sugar transporter subunit IIA [Deltaproteobacteria bacterium]
MRILDALSEGAIIAELNATEKKQVLEELTVPLAKDSGVNHEEMVRVLLEREHLGSTGIGDGIAIPHGKLKSIQSLLMAFGRSRKGVDFEAIDRKPAHLFFLLLAPEDCAGTHLRMLARLSHLLKDATFRERLMSAADAEELYAVIAEEDNDF